MVFVRNLPEFMIAEDCRKKRKTDSRCRSHSYINLPVGGVTLVIATLMLKSSLPLGADPTKRSTRDVLHQTLRMDWIGATLVLGAVTCLVLALQWGGNQKPWNSGAVIACFVVAGVTAIALVFWMRWMGDRALVPPKVFKSISVYAICGSAFFTRCALLMFTYYIPSESPRRIELLTRGLIAF